MPTPSMPIDTYSGLVQAVQLWADRDDDEFVNQIPNFIDFAQKEICRVVRNPALLKEAYMQIVNGRVAVPSDYLEGKYMRRITTTPLIRETNIEEVFYNNGKNPQDTIDSVKEIIFARLGQYYYFHPQINSSLPEFDITTGLPTYSGDEIVFTYYWDIPRMSFNTTDEDTPTMLKLAPELYLYGALKHACVFMQDKDSEKMWADRQEKAFEEIEKQTKSEIISTSGVAIPTPNAKAFW